MCPDVGLAVVAVVAVVDAVRPCGLVVGVRG